MISKLKISPRIARLAEGSTAAELMEQVRGSRRTARRAQRALTLDDLRLQIQGAQNEPPATADGDAVCAVALSIGTLCYVQLRSSGNSGGHTKISI